MSDLKKRIQEQENFMEVYKTTFLKLEDSIKKEDLTSFVDLVIELANGLGTPVPNIVAEAFNNKDVGIARLFLLDLMSVEK